MKLQLQILKQERRKSSIKMQDMITEKYEFTIVPLQIITKSDISTSTPKSIVIKLGQSVGKTATLGAPLKLLTQVMHSKVSGKYCPVKGIIKVYDIMSDGNQIICCVGTFQTQDILQQRIAKQIITKNIGLTTLKMQVSANRSIELETLQVQSQLMRQSISEVSSQRMIQNSEGSHHIINLQDSITDDNQSIRQLRRVNTLNPGQTYSKSDVIDLKSAINFGPSNSIRNSLCSVSNSTNKIQMKANILQRNNHRQSQSFMISENKKVLSPTGKAVTTKQLYSIPRINPKSSLQQFYRQQEHDKNSEASELDLQLQSKKSNKQNSQKKLQNLKIPPTLCLPLFSRTNQTQSGKNEEEDVNIKTDEFYDEINESPLMIASVKHIGHYEDNTHQNFNKKNMLTSKYSMGSDNSNDNNLGTLMKSIYNFGFIPKIESSKQIALGNTTNNNNKSNPDLSMSNASITTSVVNQYQKMEIQTLGEQLVEERRKNIDLQKKIQKYHFKIIAAKQKYVSLLHQWDEWCYSGQKFIQNLRKDENGQYLIQLKKNKELISMKYNVNNQGQSIFMNFLRLTIQNSSSYDKNQMQKKLKTEGSQFSQHKTRLPSQISEISSPELNQVLQKIQSTYANNTRLLKIQQQLNEQINHLSQHLQKNKKMLIQSQAQRTRLKQEINQHEKTVQHLNFKISSISEINTYLKQKDQQMENIIGIKESTIDNMKKILQQNNVELDELEEEVNQCKKVADNKELMLQQMRQELADKEEIIELYREVYGEINRYSRNKDTDLSIQSCIRTIIQNNRIYTNHNDLGDHEKEIEAIDQEAGEDNISQVGVPNNPIQDNNRTSLKKGSKRRSLSIEDVGLADSIGNLSNGRSSIPSRKSARVQRNQDRNLLISIIRNNQKIYTIKPEDIKAIWAQLKIIYHKIDDYILKLQGQHQLFQSLK